MLMNRYKKNVQSLSKVFRDQPDKALDRAVFWIEYILRHKGKYTKLIQSFKWRASKPVRKNYFCMFVLPPQVLCISAQQHET